MALTRLKTWVKETLTFQDLNAEFNNILNNAATLISPATATWDLDGNTLLTDSDGDSGIITSVNNQLTFQLGGTPAYIMNATQFDLTGKLLDLDDDNDTSISAAVDDTIQIEIGGTNIYTLTATAFDFNGKELILDADQDSSLTVDTDDVAHLRLQAFDAFIFDGDVASPVNGITFTSAATGVAPSIIPQGVAASISLAISPKGTGTLDLDLNAGELILDADGDSSLTVDTDDVAHLRLQAFDAFIFDGDVASPVNGLTFTASATGVDVSIAAHGETNTSIDLLPAGTGTVKINGTNLLVGTKTAVLQEQQTSGTGGGGFTSGAWRDRVLTTTVSDPGSIVTDLTAGEFTLEAGTYKFEAFAVGYVVEAHQARIQNTADATTVALGSSAYALAASAVPSVSLVYGITTIAAQKTFKVQHICETTRATDGMGRAGTLGVNEVYSGIIITQLA
jgi:hypothetical protein